VIALLEPPSATPALCCEGADSVELQLVVVEYIVAK
jgi:hypothetical protein